MLTPTEQELWTTRHFNADVIYATARGDSPVGEYIDGLPDPEAAVVLRYIELLRAYGTRLQRPIVDHIDDALWELRPGPHRVFYFVARGRRCVLLHAYRKHSQKAPRPEIDRARRYMEDWLEREGDGAGYPGR